MTELSIKGDVVFSVQNMKKGNAVTNTMPSGELVVNDVVDPCGPGQTDRLHPG